MGINSRTLSIDGALYMPCDHCPSHEANGGDPTVDVLDFPCTHTQRGHGHLGHSTTGDTMEGGIGAHRHSYKRHSPFP